MSRLTDITDPCGYVTNLGHDASENVTDVNDAEEHNTHYDYDERDLLWKVTDANNGITEYGYTLNGKLKTIKDPNGNITTYNYDGFDRLTKITYPNDSNEQFTYDKRSNVTSFKNRGGAVIRYEYDVLNRLITKTRPDEQAIIFLYDIVGRLVRVSQGTAPLVSYCYDRLGRLITNADGRTVKYEYDNIGRRRKLVYPDDTYITYWYDAMSRLTDIKDQSGNRLVHYAYDELSRRTVLTYGSDANTVYEYDIANQLKKLTNKFSSTQSQVFEYSDYDKVGNRKNMIVDTTAESKYKYDKLYQLIFADYPSAWSIADTNYYYDKLENRTSIYNGSTMTYSRNKLNQYTQVDSNNFSYDDNGNLTSINSDDYEYVYDCENRLIEAKENSVTIASYKYDYLGRRVSKTVGATTIKYAYDGDRVVAEYSGAGTLLRKYVYGVEIDEVLAMIDVSTGNVYYYHYDALGSVIALTDNTGTIVEKYRYDVFGGTTILSPNNELRTTSLYGNTFMFTGRQYDTETGLYYYRARYYKPSIGRFLQTDPVSALNLYTYCENNPVMLIDPWGEDWIDTGANYFAGFADHLSFGVTGWIRSGIGVESVVDRSGFAYKSGVVSGIVYDVVSTGGSLALQKSAAKVTARQIAKDRVRAREVLGLVKGDSKFAHHVNPLKGHPGGGKTMFPTAGLPDWIKNSRANLAALDKAQHLAADGKLKEAEAILRALGVGNEWIAGARTGLSVNRLLESGSAKDSK